MAQRPALEEAEGEGADWLFLLSTDVVAFFLFLFFNGKGSGWLRD